MKRIDDNNNYAKNKRTRKTNFVEQNLSNLQFCQVNCRNIDGATPLCDACSSGSVECVKLLLENGACVNPQLLLSSPLHEAVLRGARNSEVINNFTMCDIF